MLNHYIIDVIIELFYYLLFFFCEMLRSNEFSRRTFLEISSLGWFFNQACNIQYSSSNNYSFFRTNWIYQNLI